MGERPIIMSGESVRAIVDGRQSQTRRVVKMSTTGVRAIVGHAGQWQVVNGVAMASHKREWIRCPYGQPGDRLWVRETWAVGRLYDYTRPSEIDAAKPPHVLYPASQIITNLRCRPPIHMPRWASRLTLELTGVRVERVQDIRLNVRDMEAEGIALSPSTLFPQTNRAFKLATVYEKLWDKLNAKRGYGWDVNPWVWVLEFRKVDARAVRTGGET